ncbi:AAA family ATPase [Faecalicatena orotica]|uniref:PD-(D/E)XK nuclease superfamily protein n=1 Tax=Faecalicatena orotica TaxID=1544 RepID=A0A2Y9BCS6_9FIRM|nr:AAA family ATPase [Faecalicatena orotica]PWJ29731.1 PD-(D/E)XK nuclease superfamily protein [Faecalicatena orotica]SSA55455.1 PD-(D/E)XK nuclease superfamily protein [Faecalicatena orotica]
MSRTVGIGNQDFSVIRTNNYFYIDKTGFIKEWWDSGDHVTLITRPRRFGKTLTMSMTEQFFSVHYAGRGDLFEGLEIWKGERYREIQGTYPTISLTFANVKEPNFEMTKQRINQILTDLYNENIFLLDGSLLTDQEKEYFKSVRPDMDEVTATMAIHKMSDFLSRYYRKRVIILLDEYDTPMQEAYVSGYWNELVTFTRSMFNAAFKTNPYLERAIMTGITRISKESIFSDLNNLKVVTTTTDKYEDSFGFTEKEVYEALEEYGLYGQKHKVKRWYDGFTFGKTKDIYNPWSIINYLDEKKTGAYWANTSSNGMIGKVIREGSSRVKEEFESLLAGESIVTEIDEEIVYNQLGQKENAIWSLMLASGYLKVKRYEAGGDEHGGRWRETYELELTNFEVKIMFQNMVQDWFAASSSSYNDFLKALLSRDVEAMNVYMNRVALTTFSYFDTGGSASRESEPERFYHGFVLGLMVELSDKYILTSNRESGFGRYDVMLEPKRDDLDAIILEFKVFNPRKESNLEETVEAALEQIKRKQYSASLAAKGIPEKSIRQYGFAFRGKQVLIGQGDCPE